MSLIIKTRRIRQFFAMAALKFFTPNLAAQIKDMTTRQSAVPRPFTNFLKSYYGDKSLVGVEIGFGYGYNAESLLTELNIKKLFCVEPFLLKKWMQGSTLIDAYVDDKKSLFPKLVADKRVSFVHLPSDAAFSVLPYNLDFVYVDGNHTYDFVQRDILNSLNHVAAEGVVGGHDFWRGYEVIQAVLDLTVKLKLAPTVDEPDFWFVKKTIANDI